MGKPRTNVLNLKRKPVFNTDENVSQQLTNPQVSVPIFADLTEETK